MATILDNEISEVDVNQALVDLKNHGVCKSKARMDLLQRGYIQIWSSTYKPIPWAIDALTLTEAGKEKVLELQIEQLDADSLSHDPDRDLFVEKTIKAKDGGSLSFTPERIKDEIAKGNHLELGRAAGSPLPDQVSAATYPEYFGKVF